MAPERVLLGFNVFLYCVNGFLWEAVAHIHSLALASIITAVASAYAFKKLGE